MPNTPFAKKKQRILYQDYIITKTDFCIVSGNPLTKTPPDETLTGSVCSGKCLSTADLETFTQNELHRDLLLIQLPDTTEVTSWEMAPGL